MPTLEMTKQEVFEARQSFIAERIAIMIHDGGMAENDAAIEAGKCWDKYLMHVKRAEQSQRTKGDDHETRRFFKLHP